ncbi:hypothetical protein FQR65_LT16344 [Abscondita terminalis]|nr:hypothetical protein FQR65_LT16344 [Abscondita terminalis]
MLRDTSDPLFIPENQFKGIYRMSRQLVHNLILDLAPHLQEPRRETLFIPKKLKIMVALHFFSQGSYQKGIGQDYLLSMSQSSVSNCINAVNNAMQNLYHLVHFPNNEQELTTIKQGNNTQVMKRMLRDTSDPLFIPENQFKGIYRMSRQLVHNLILDLAPHLQEPRRETLFIPKKLKIMVALHFFSQGSYQKGIGQDYLLSMSQSSVSNCINAVNNAMQNLYHLVHFPNNEQELTTIKQGNNTQVMKRMLRDTSDPLFIPENQFKGIYRMSRQLVHNLILDLAPHLQEPRRETLFIPKKLKIMVALHFFSQGSYQKGIGQDYLLSMSQSSVSNCINAVNNAMQNLYHLVHFPNNEQELTTIKQG